MAWASIDRKYEDLRRMAEPDVRKGMPAIKLPRGEFEKRFRNRFRDPAFAPVGNELDRIIAAAWDAYSNSRKHPTPKKPGPASPIPNTRLLRLVGGTEGDPGSPTAP